MKLCYIAAHDGVYTYSLTDDGTLSLLDRLTIDRPMYLALDGGRLRSVGIEMVTRKRIPLKVESMINLVGLVILLGFSMFILVKDVIQLII